jgi:colanic acid biosynthesis glycosyl transferase WcaI
LRILLLNQCFYPDVVATAQHLTDLATALTSRGHDVTVLTGDRGYDHAGLRFPRREKWNGITILRIPSLALGKDSKWRRGLNFGSFLSICALRLLFLRRFDVVVALTSPPLISFLAALFVQVKGGRLFCWIMDLNPDEAIAAGWLKSDSWSTRLLQRMLDYSLRTAERVVVLDRFVKDRIQRREIELSRISVIPPWSHSDVVSYSAEGRQAFRAKHHLSDKFVVMYSGNHSPCHPLDTLLEAVLHLRTREELVFCFVGGGSEQAKVREFAALHRLGNVMCLPYQPLEHLSDSLSSADMHVVVIGDPFVGIIHPCKIYNIMAIGTPVLYIGPSTSHVMDLVNEFPANHFFRASHGDRIRVVKHILECANLSALSSSFSDLRWVKSADRSAHSKEVLLPQLCAFFEPAGLFVQEAANSPVLSVTNELES